MIGGYSFKDRPLNRVLRLYVPPNTPITVIDPNPSAELVARQALGIADKDPRLTHLSVPLEDGLPEGL